MPWEETEQLKTHKPDLQQIPYNLIGEEDKKNKRKIGDNTSELLLLEGGSVTIPMEVLRQVTNNFSEANILGRGGFGTVYFGELLDGTKVAMKRMEFSAMNKQGTNEFQAEIVVLTKVRHKHVVSLSWVTV
ncbi:hypothetical protein F2Q68_00032517 [Brassica cretica]|uniref:Protein kinase domain-containing protein n=1 Tax=Brassica cretica TaxID=69181 RepID=A0A8S9GGM8_BRACR|nr:hypothetical protein F2Q68_00032517 [Brassica cretica]